MSQLDPTYKFFLEAGIVVLVLAFLCLLVGGTVFVAWRWIRYSDNALKAKKEGREADDKAKRTEMELEEIRLKMVGELASQIASLTTQIASQSTQITQDREHDRTIRERELEAINKLVNAVDENNKLLGSYKTDSESFRAKMTTQSDAMMREVQQTTSTVEAIDKKVTEIHSGLSSVQDVKAVVVALEKALSDLPKTIQKTLSPYCERLDVALKKLETIQVEEKDHVPTVENLPDSHPIHLAGNPLVVHPSLHADANESPNPNHPLSNSDGEGGGHNQPVSPGEISSGKPTSESDTGSPATD